MKAKTADPLQIHGIRLGPELTEEQAKAIFALGEQAVVFALLAQAKSLAEQNGDTSPPRRSDDPSCPSGQKPAYEKPTTKGRKKKPGRKPGHEGHRRAKPDHIDHHEQHRQSHCPECGGTLTRCHVSRKRYIEDIPEDVHVEVTEHTVHRDWCPRCRKMVEPKVPDALPNATVVKRLRRHRHELFTFVVEHDVPFENNVAERIIRQAVIMRKNSYNNRSAKGASTQAILMSVFTTLKQGGLHPIKTVEQALRTYITTGKLPPLKDFAAAQR